MTHKDLIKDYISSKDTMTLAVIDGKLPWVCNVFYFMDNDLNLYYLSEKDSRHSTPLHKNPNVAVSIYDHESIPGKVSGVQISGTCSELSGKDLLMKMGKYISKFPSIKKYFNTPKDIIEKGTSSRIFKVEPSYIKLFSSSSIEKVVEIKLG